MCVRLQQMEGVILKKIHVVGIGPGDPDQMTILAAKTLENSDLIVGYSVYVDLIKKQYPEKDFMTTPMRKETERCRLALQEAEKGRAVSVVCSGDAGVYGMAGLLYETAREYRGVEIKVIPGVTAALSGAALLGAPLSNDFCVISLSDLLTPWETIEKRLLCAAEADFVICLYNPSSRKRADHLQKACDLVLKHRSENTVCGTALNIGREGEEIRILTLGELRDTPADMFTTVFIGNSETLCLMDRMVTPRGYQNKI